jgi:hypothetical protein
MELNSAMEKVCFGKWNEKDLQILYDPIKDLFELNPEADSKYEFYVKEGKRGCTPEEMKYIMLPRKDLLGKATKSIGVSQFGKYLKDETKKINGEFNEVEVEVQTKSEKVKSQNLKKYYIPKQARAKLWRYRLLDTYFLDRQPQLSPMKLSCPLCGFAHKFKNLRVELPVNLYVVNITNYTSYMSGKSSYSICPYCTALLMRTLVEEHAPEKIYFWERQRRAYLYILPFDPESEIPYERFSRKRAEELIKKEFDSKGWEFKEIYALDYVLTLPILVCTYLPHWKGKTKPAIYMAFADISGGTETITDQVIITRLDFLATVGKELKNRDWLKAIQDFKQRLLSFIKEFKDVQKINGYKLIFRFLSRMLAEGKIDFTFLHRVLRKEIGKEENPRLWGYSYINAFLKGGRYG